MTRILIIDDDAALRRVLRIGLEGKGLQVQEARDGAEGMRLLRQNGADVVLCDVFMPGQDGVETLVSLKQEFPDLPAVSMSGGGFDGRIDMLPVALHLGAGAVLHKPFAFGALLEALQRVLPSAP